MVVAATQINIWLRRSASRFYSTGSGFDRMVRGTPLADWIGHGTNLSAFLDSDHSTNAYRKKHDEYPGWAKYFFRALVSRSGGNTHFGHTTFLGYRLSGRVGPCNDKRTGWLAAAYHYPQVLLDKTRWGVSCKFSIHDFPHAGYSIQRLQSSPHGLGAWLSITFPA